MIGQCPTACHLLILMGVDTQIEVVLLDIDDDVHTTAVD